NPQTYVQSGNVIFQSGERDLEKVVKRIQQGIEKKFACRPEVILRTTNELRAVISKNPFGKRRDLDPAKLLVSFLASEPVPGGGRALGATENQSGGAAPVWARALHLFPKRGRKIQVTLVADGQNRRAAGHRPQLELCDQDAGDGRGAGSSAEQLDWPVVSSHPL